MRKLLIWAILALLAPMAASASTNILPNDPGIVYSPYCWNVSSSSAITIQSGCYIRTLFTGSSLTIKFDTTNATSVFSQFWYRVDEGAGVWTLGDLSTSSTVVSMPALTTGYAYHSLEIITKSFDPTIDWWNMPSPTAYVFTGLTLDTAATVSAPGVKLKNVLFYGDSIGQGGRTVFNANSVPSNDNSLAYTFGLRDYINAEVGIASWSAQGWTVAPGAPTNVPSFQNSWNLLYQGVSRTFTPTPDLVLINQGTNGGVTTADCETITAAIQAALPQSTKFVIMEPFNGASAANLQACAAARGVYYMDTTGFYNTADGGDGVHPTGVNHLDLILPKVAAALMPILWGPFNPWTHYH